MLLQFYLTTPIDKMSNAMAALRYFIKTHMLNNTATLTLNKMVVNLNPVASLLLVANDEAVETVTAAPDPVVVVVVPAPPAALSNNCLTAKYAGFFL